MNRLGKSVTIALAGASTLWAAIAVNTILVPGYELGYLDGGQYPLYPTLDVTYLSLALLSMPIVLLLTAALALLTLLLPRPLAVPLLAGLWLAAAWLAAGAVAFEFQIDFGTTWTPREAITTLFWRPWITLPALATGLLLFVTLCRAILKRPKRRFL